MLKYNQAYSNDDPGLTLTYFMARLNLVPHAFVWEKGKTMDFSELIVVYDVIWLMQLTKWLHEPIWISNVKVSHWPWSKVAQIQYYNCFL